jgi:hypothetical protein
MRKITVGRVLGAVHLPMGSIGGGRHGCVVQILTFEIKESSM